MASTWGCPVAELELTGTVAEDVEQLLNAQEACETEERHVPHRLWDWRCECCMCLLCTDCGNEVERCTCTEGASHGRAA